MDPGSNDFHVYLVIWTLLINIVVVWTPLVVFLVKKLGRMDQIGIVVDRYGLDKIAERVNTVEQLVYTIKDSITNIPARVVALEELTRNFKLQIADYPARVTALEIKSVHTSEQLQDHPARVTALEVLTKRMQEDDIGVPAKVIALEVITKRLQELLILPGKIVAIELFQENVKSTVEKITIKLDILETEHTRMMGKYTQCKLSKVKGGGR